MSQTQDIPLESIMAVMGELYLKSAYSLRQFQKEVDIEVGKLRASIVELNNRNVQLEESLSKLQEQKQINI